MDTLLQEREAMTAAATPVTITAGNRINAKGGFTLARRRYQQGRLFQRGARCKVWVGRWREDVIEEGGRLKRVHRSEVLGTVREIPTLRLAKRALESRLAVVNASTYRARPTATFTEFAAKWEATVLPQHKPSTQASTKSLIRRVLLPFFGARQMREIDAEMVQRFVSSLTVKPKTVRNAVMAVRTLWKSARAWGYVAHDACDGVVLPGRNPAETVQISLEDVVRILGAADEPWRTLYWLVAETGMRAGEVCGLRVDDLDLEKQWVVVRQSVWQGKEQTTKSSRVRQLAISAELAAHLRGFLINRWRANERRLLFTTRNLTPYEQGNLVKRYLHPLLKSLGLPQCGLHAFRHANATMMDGLGAPLRLRQDRLGHADPTLTLGVYTHSVGEDHRTLAGQLGRVLCPIVPKLKSEGVASGTQPLCESVA